MQVFINYPDSEEILRIFNENLVLFKAKLILKSIENLNVAEESKNKILEKVFEILNDKSMDEVI